MRDSRTTEKKAREKKNPNDYFDDDGKNFVLFFKYHSKLEHSLSETKQIHNKII